MSRTGGPARAAMGTGVDRAASNARRQGRLRCLFPAARRTVGAEVGHLAAQQQEEAVEEAKGVGGGGVDGGAHGDTVGGQRLDHRHHLVGGVAVQAAGGLIQEQHAGAGDQGDADVDALGLGQGGGGGGARKVQGGGEAGVTRRSA